MTYTNTHEEYCPECKSDQTFTTTETGVIHEQDGQHNDDIEVEVECNCCGYSYLNI